MHHRADLPTILPEQQSLASPKPHQDIDWLKDVLKERDGFTDFMRNRGHRLDTPALVAHWAFAASVVDDYHHKPSGVPGPSMVW